MKLFIKCALVGFFYAPLAWSQCSGVNTGGGCVPPPCTPGSPLACNQAQPQASPRPQPVWADRWGAIVIDNEAGDTGTTTERVSRADAIEAASHDCMSHGAKHCKVAVAYYNQCAAIAWGSGYNGVAGAPTETLAKSNAMNDCGRGASDCKIVYSACSMAERIR
jgi:hypothetical protein